MMITTNGRARDWRKFFHDGLVVTLDGVAVKDVAEADDAAGYLIRLVRDAAGKLIVNGNRIATERLEGTVVFTGTKRRWNPDDAKAAAAAKRARRHARNLTIQNRADVRGAGAA